MSLVGKRKELLSHLLWVLPERPLFDQLLGLPPRVVTLKCEGHRSHILCGNLEVFTQRVGLIDTPVRRFDGLHYREEAIERHIYHLVSISIIVELLSTHFTRSSLLFVIATLEVQFKIRYEQCATGEQIHLSIGNCAEKEL